MMTADLLITLFFGLVVFLFLVICYLVFVGWRKNVSDRKLVGFLIAQMFPELLRRNAKDRKTRDRIREAQKTKTFEITEALKEVGIEVKPGETAMGAMKKWLNSDQTGNIAPRPEKE